MQNFVIEGARPLKGTVRVSGSKNEVLKSMAAALLTNELVVLKNVPEVSDVLNMISILKRLGADASYSNHVVRIRARKISSHPDNTLVQSMRASVVLMGALVGRLGKAEVAFPGGDVIGVRPITTHLDAFRNLGIKITETKAGIKLTGKPVGAKVVLREISVTATENTVMAAVLAKGDTEISLAATEPHVEDLCRMLVKMGAKITGIGTHRIKIKGVKKLHGVEHTIIPDQLEAATFAILGLATKSEITVNGFVAEHHDVLLNKFDEMGVRYKLLPKNMIQTFKWKKLKPTKIRTDIYPNFPSDYQAPMAVLLTQAMGQSEIFETMYEGRLNYVYELQKMGASINLEDNHTVKINGPTPLTGTEIRSFDIRAGATLIIAALVAKGRSVIHDIEHIDRGYEKIDEKLRSIGAKIERINR